MIDAANDLVVAGCQYVGSDRVRGTLEPGKEADQVIVDRDPLTDITALGSVCLVMLGGMVVHEAPTHPGPSREAST